MLMAPVHRCPGRKPSKRRRERIAVVPPNLAMYERPDPRLDGPPVGPENSNDDTAPAASDARRCSDSLTGAWVRSVYNESSLPKFGVSRIVVDPRAEPIGTVRRHSRCDSPCATMTGEGEDHGVP